MERELGLEVERAARRYTARPSNPCSRAQKVEGQGQWSNNSSEEG